MKILVIGGSRFVGPLLVNKLVADGHKVTVFNRGTHDVDFPEGVKKVVGDRNKEFGLNEHFEVVIDMCAYNGVQTKSALDSLSFDLFVHFGSIASYKHSEVFPLDEKSETGFWPLMGNYGKGKVECEKVLADSGKKFASIRPTYILGPKNYLDRESFIYSKLKNSEVITLPGNGQAITQFVFADDVVDILSLIVKNRATGAYNCVGDELVTLKGLVEMMAEVAGAKAKLAYNSSTDGENHDEAEFPFANGNAIFTNQKSKDLGHAYTPLLKGLKEEYQGFYRTLT